MKNATLLMVTSSAVALTLGGPAQAQTAAPAAPTQNIDAGSTGEIVVTARKRQEKLIDVPETIVALSNQALKTNGVVDFNHLSQQTPGVLLSERGTGVPNATIRGVGAFGYVQGVGFYIDDVQNFTDQTMSLRDVDRIEILKGPQGTLYGGSNLGGAVRYIVKEPNYTPSGEVSVEGGNHNYVSGYGALNIPLVDDKLAVRLSGYMTHDDRFQHDKNLGKPTNPKDDYSIRGQILATPTDRLRLLLTARLHDDHGGGFSYAPASYVGQGPQITDLFMLPDFDRRTWAAVGKINYDLDFADLVSITSFTSQKYKFATTAGYTTKLPPNRPPQSVVGNGAPTEVYTEELRLTSQGVSQLSWVVGAYAARSDNVGMQGGPYATINGIVNGGASPTGILFYDRSTRQTNLALFGSADYRFGNFTLTTGLRFNHTVAEGMAKVIQTVPAVQPGDPVDSTSVLPHYKVKGDVLLPKVSLAYKTEGGANIYATVSAGYEPGRIDLGVVPPHPFKAEKTWNYEVGIKGYALDSALYYELAGFYIDDRDRQLNGTYILTLPNGATTVARSIANVGDSTNKGVEASLNWSVTRDLVLNGAVSYLRARWKSGAKDGNGGSITGERVPNSPDWTGNIGATYTAHLPSGYQLALRGSGSYTGSFPWTTDYATHSNIEPSYWVVDARIALTPPSGNWELSVRGNNITNAHYDTEFTSNYTGVEAADGTCNACHLAVAGFGRRFIVALDMKF